MSNIIKPGAGILFMKVGVHAQEELDDIIARKSKEIEDTGYGMWGYGGNTCHPTTMVQPFADEYEKRGDTIHLVMEEIESNHRAAPSRATECSMNGIDWELIPETINVLGSKYALLIEELRRETFVLPLDQTRVPVGRSSGKLGARYVQGRVDKACLEVLEHPELSNVYEPRNIRVGLVAKLRKPYAVFLKDRGK
ncbi:hypothetical protein [Roseibium aggregatum]|uniref:Uncharacterized protein n=1 Tax=Roseibium aggregatum TaxID=187304 RepID=A0A939J3B1_9HYPH|nr:hypothetical protein [Roseibium aggregatum]MBN9669479.1 hypothetical protein [Roseibium aggregatum]